MHIGAWDLHVGKPIAVGTWQREQNSAWEKSKNI